MYFERFSKQKPRPNHLTSVLEVLDKGESLSPHEIMRKTELSLTAVHCALAYLEKEDHLILVQQKVSPKVRVSLKKVIEQQCDPED